MTDTPELNVWREAMNAYYVNDRIEDGTEAVAVIRTYGDQRYQAAIDDVVKWLNAKQEGRTSDNYPAFYANEITRRFGKGQYHG